MAIWIEPMITTYKTKIGRHKAVNDLRHPLNDGNNG